MSENRRRSGWWPVGLFVLGLGALAFVEERAHLTTAGRTIAQLAGVLLIYGLLFLWLHVNQAVLLNEMCEDLARRPVSTTEPEPEPDQIVEVGGKPDDVPSLHPEFACHQASEHVVVQRMQE